MSLRFCVSAHCDIVRTPRTSICNKDRFGVFLIRNEVVDGPEEVVEKAL